MENQTMTQKNPLNHQHIFPVLLKVLSFVTKKIYLVTVNILKWGDFSV